MEFSEKDVLIVAKAVLEDPLNTISGDYGTEIFCTYCDAELQGNLCSFTDFKHEVGCPVLVAQDLLTGIKE